MHLICQMRRRFSVLKRDALSRTFVGKLRIAVNFFTPIAEALTTSESVPTKSCSSSGMRMSLENWVKNSWLERRDPDEVEIARLLALADGRLKDYHRAVAGKLSFDVRLGLAYDAIRIALRAAGYRVVRGGSEHYRIIEAP
jgi:hypothetical protein